MPNMPNTQNLSNTISTAEAARKLQISERTLREWIKNGYIKATKLNPLTKSVYRIPLDEIHRILTERARANR